jgi:hypothetical protein
LEEIQHSFVFNMDEIDSIEPSIPFQIKTSGIVKSLDQSRGQMPRADHSISFGMIWK